MMYREIVIFNATRSDSASISTFQRTAWGMIDPVPSTVTTPDGFTWTPQYHQYWHRSITDVYGQDWQTETPGNQWSEWVASNISNGTSMFRHEVRQWDTDIDITSAERGEADMVGNLVNSGADFDTFFQFLAEPGQSHTGNGWCASEQQHYDNETQQSSLPCGWVLNLMNDTLKLITQWGPNPGGTDVTIYSTPLVRNTWYSFRVAGHYGNDGLTDQIQVWVGTNGSALTQVANITSGHLYHIGHTNWYHKRGIYRGYTYSFPLAVRIANYRAVGGNRTAFASYVASPPPLPAHA